MRVYTLQFHLYKILDNANCSIVTESSSVVAKKPQKLRGSIKNGDKETCEGDIFMIFTVVTVSWVNNTYIKT